jgi:hypothetical protein
MHLLLSTFWKVKRQKNGTTIQRNEKKNLTCDIFYCVVIRNFLAPLSGYKHGFMVSKVLRFYFKILAIFFFRI